MDRASRGDDEAFGALAASAQDELYRFSLAQGLCGADAAEAVQEAFLRAYRKRTRWRTGGDALAWLCGIALNVARECRKKRRRRAEVPADVGLLSRDDARQPPAGQDVEALADALEALPPRQRQAVSCRYLRRMNVPQTAAVMGCAEGTVRAACFAGLRNLRRLLPPP
jgi:RNA polymerase sigma-70 factor (ECF subfamily)